MILAVFLGLALVALVPLALVLRRVGAGTRGTRDPALALHRTQLSELDRDLAEGRILPAEHATALLEVQRRLLAVADDRPVRTGSSTPVLVTLLIVPLVAMGLYLVGGQPGMPTIAPGSPEMALIQQRAADDALVEGLRERVQALDPSTPQAREGYVLLGTIEEARGRDAAAAAAWLQALQIRFDPALAVRAAEALSRAEGHVTDASAALSRQALVGAPPDAPWRAAAEAQLGAGAFGPRKQQN